MTLQSEFLILVAAVQERVHQGNLARFILVEHPMQLPRLQIGTIIEAMARQCFGFVFQQCTTAVVSKALLLEEQ